MPAIVTPESVQPEEEAEAGAEEAAAVAEEREEREARAEGGRRRRRRRRRPEAAAAAKPAEGEEPGVALGEAEEGSAVVGEEGGEEQPRKRRRGRRGGRRGRRGRGGEDRLTAGQRNGEALRGEARPGNGATDEEAIIESHGTVGEEPLVSMETPSAVDAETASAAEAATSETSAEAADRETASQPVVERMGEDESDRDRPKRSGWWQRRSFF
jgi:ribonuclease E